MPVDDQTGSAAPSGIGARIHAASPRPAAEPRRAELHRAAEATRRLIDELGATDAPEDVLREATATISAALADLEDHRRDPLRGWAEVANAGGEPGAEFDNSPLIGKANPLAPPMVLENHGDRIEGRVTFGAAYEGPPGCVHGGYVAAMFDELLGAAQSLSGRAGMTGTLTVRYRKPTPLHTELVVAAWFDLSEGRKIFVRGTCRAGRTTTAEAEGIFVSVDVDRFATLAKVRQERLAARAAAADDPDPR